MAIDPGLFIHPSDKAALAALQAIPGFSQVTKAFMKAWTEKLFRLINMSTNLKISDQQMKKYYDMLPPICYKLGIDVPEMYVELDPIPNAYTAGDTEPFIVLTTGLFETLPDELIPSVIAHECGHIACHHQLYSTMGRFLLKNAEMFVSGLGTIALYPIQLAFAYWMRCSEFSADRAAAVCDGNADRVIEVMMRFAGYDKDIAAEANIEAFLEQAQAYRALSSDGAMNKGMTFFLFKDNSHPLNAVRAYEAREWVQSERFQIIMAGLGKLDGAELPIALSPWKFYGKSSEQAKEQLFDMGFTNIKFKATAIPKIGLFMKPNTVARILMDGIEAPAKEAWFSPDTEIVVYYYVAVD